MSFGFGVGDFLAVGKLCWDVYTKCKDSPGNYKQLSGEVSSMYAVIRETELLLSKQGLSPEQQARLATCRQGCEAVLKDLDGLLVKYEGLGTKSQRTFDRLAFGSHDMDAIRLRLISNVSMLDAFNNASSHEKLEKKLDMLISEVRAGKREGSVVSTRSFATAAENENETWDALRRELEDIGISPEIITEKRHFIVAWFQEAVAAGRLEEEAPSDEDADSIADQNSQSSVGKSHSNSVINRESSSHVLVQETFTRSSCDLNNHDIPLPFTSSRSAIRSQGEAVMKTGLAAESSVESTKAQKLPKLEKRSRLSVSYLLSKLLGKEGQLLEAAIVGDLDRVRALLDEGVEIEARDKVGATALINTATHGHSQIVRLLFDYGANVNATTTGGETALLKAVEHGHSQIVRLLLDHGANVNVTTMWHKTALSTAAEQDETVDIVQMLLDNNAEINEPGTRYPPLIVAARQESMAVLQLLIDRGANVESGDLFCRTALRVAALSGRERAVRLLIENGAAIEAPNSLGNTVLFTAAGSDGLSKVVKLLLEKGANTEAIGDLGFTPLHKAAISDCGDNARLLIEYGAKTDSRDKHGRTPLQLAEQTKKKAVMQVLRRQESLELFRRHK